MNERDASPPPNLRPRRAERQSGLIDRERIASSSFDRADATSNPFTTDSTVTPKSSDEVESALQTSPQPETLQYDESRLRSRVQTRGHNKHRSSGAFLLSDPVAAITHDHDALAHSQSQRRRRDAADREQRVQERLHPRDARLGEQTLDPGLGRTRSERISTSSAVTKGESLAGETVIGSSPRTSIAPLDADSAQIVKMALNLSESRRLASRRNVSQPIPPRLAPLPDTTASGSLRQHLQQQRRVSRTISPKPDRSPRVGPPRILSPLQSAFEPESTYRYHFSQSTLNRAQKAKEYLELMAQYRRVLDLLPPLKPGILTRPSTASPPASPNGSVQVFRIPTNLSENAIGRPYDPLQYIRNRKVRARERKTIDGETQGFNDVVKVSEWVDDVSRWVATGQVHAPGTPSLPPFAGADIVGTQSSPSAVSSRSVVSSAKAKRPRVDWVIDPADMLADIYWLEQDDNKRLVEDRHWRRIYPQDANLSRPLSHDEPGRRLATPGSNNEPSESHTATENASTETLPHKHEHEHVFSTARDRAQQKLRALRETHHRHTSSIHNRDFLRIHRGSVSESSDTDNDRKRRARNGTISSSGKDLLAKQVEELAAQEQKQQEKYGGRDLERPVLYDHEALRMEFNSPGLMTPEREDAGTLPAPNRPKARSRTDSRAEFSENEFNFPGLKQRPSPSQHQQRASLEVPQRGRRPSIDYDTSQPNSPDLRALRDSALMPAIGMDLSPMSSRPNSPTRNPLTKVRGIFRERSRERPTDIRTPIAEDSAEYFPAPLPSLEKVDSPGWVSSQASERDSKSPPRKETTGRTHSSHKSHRSMGSIKLRGEDGIGIRSLFRAPRIDSVLRSSVSKVSDMIWRKEGGVGDEQSSSTSADESELEHNRRGRRRGRSKGSVVPHRPSSRHGRESDPTPQLLSPIGPTSLSAPGSYPASRPVSRHSSRFELLKPPRIDVQNASPAASPPPEAARPQDLDVSETESRKSNYADAPRPADDPRVKAILSLPKPPQVPVGTSNRHWSAIDGINFPASTVISRREVARSRILLLRFGIKAMEMERRAKERRLLANTHSPARSPSGDGSSSSSLSDAGARFAWPDVASLCTDTNMRARLFERPIAQTEVYPLAGRALNASIQESEQQWQSAWRTFATETAPTLQNNVESLRNRVADELTGLTQAAAEEADEVNHDLATSQRLRVKRVVDGMEKMLRRRRRRFRWVRRAGWLAVEWVLVGFMWYVWFIVMITRILLGVGKGVGRAVKWLLWL